MDNHPSSRELYFPSFIYKLNPRLNHVSCELFSSSKSPRHGRGDDHVGVLARPSLSRYSSRIGAPHGGICTHRMSLYAPWVTKHVAIHAAFLYNRDQMEEQTNFDAYHIFGGRMVQIVQRLVRLVAADQHFTKSVHRLPRTYMFSQLAYSGGKHVAASIPRLCVSLPCGRGDRPCCAVGEG
jgi:hypothetical protein